MKTLPFAALLFVALTAFTGCTSTAPKPDLPKGSSSGYTSYRLYKELPSGTTDFVNREAEVHSILQKEIDAVFQTNGLKEAGDGAELIVAYLVLQQNNAVSTGFDEYYINSGSEIVSYAHQRVAIEQDLPASFEAGTLIVDVIDAKERKLIYRDYSSKEIHRELSMAERNQRARDAVDEALAAFFK